MKKGTKQGDKEFGRNRKKVYRKGRKVEIKEKLRRDRERLN